MADLAWTSGTGIIGRRPQAQRAVQFHCRSASTHPVFGLIRRGCSLAS